MNSNLHNYKFIRIYFSLHIEISVLVITGSHPIGWSGAGRAEAAVRRGHRGGALGAGVGRQAEPQVRAQGGGGRRAAPRAALPHVAAARRGGLERRGRRARRRGDTLHTFTYI